MYTGWRNLTAVPLADLLIVTNASSLVEGWWRDQYNVLRAKALNVLHNAEKVASELFDRNMLPGTGHKQDTGLSHLNGRQDWRV